MTLDVTPVAVTGVWFRHVPAGGDPTYRGVPPASGRWQHGEVIAALYLAGDADTCWAEWYRRVAEDGVEPLEALPRDLWRYAEPSRCARHGRAARAGRLAGVDAVAS